MTAGRVLDIDIITREGSLSRTRMGFPERRCLLCGGEGEGLREAWYPLSTGAEGEGDQDNKRRLTGDVISRGFGLDELCSAFFIF